MAFIENINIKLAGYLFALLDKFNKLEKTV
jgi:hypothetical protein